MECWKHPNGQSNRTARMTYEYNEDNAELMVQPEKWDTSTDVLFLQRQLALLQNRKDILPTTPEFTQALGMFTYQIEHLNNLIDNIYNQRIRKSNQFLEL